MGVRISTWRKSAAEIAEADAELARHRAGRKERREELVERIVEERASWSREAEGKIAELTARAESGGKIDVQAVYADWLRAAAQRKDRLQNPAGHWIDFCKRRAQMLR